MIYGIHFMLKSNLLLLPQVVESTSGLGVDLVTDICEQVGTQQ